MSCHIVSCHIHVIMKTRDHHQQPQQVSGHPFLHSSLGVSNEALGAGQLCGPASRMPQISCASKLNSLAAWFHRDSHSGLWKSMDVSNISQYIGSKLLTDCYDHQPRGFEMFWALLNYHQMPKSDASHLSSFQHCQVLSWAHPKRQWMYWARWSLSMTSVLIEVGLHCIPFCLWANNLVTKCYKKKVHCAIFWAMHELCMSYVWGSLEVSALRIHYPDVKVALPVQRRIFGLRCNGVAMEIPVPQASSLISASCPSTKLRPAEKWEKYWKDLKSTIKYYYCISTVYLLYMYCIY